MWTTSNGTRNRVSPELSLSDRQNRQFDSNDWEDTSYSRNSRTPYSTSGVVVQVNPNQQETSNNLTKLIRKRKYGVQASRVDSFLKRSETGWTPSLSQRIKNKHRGNTGANGQNTEWNINESFKEVGQSIELWGGWFKRIEEHQGAGVLSYFVFLKWLLFLNVVLFIIVFIFIVIPMIHVSTKDGYTGAVTSSGLSDTTNADGCSKLYNVAYNTSAADVIQDFFQGTGWMEDTALFYGWYPAKELQRFNYIMPVAYFLTILAGILYSLVRMAIYCVSYFKQNLTLSNDHIQIEYFSKVCSGWDYTLAEENTCKKKERGIYRDLIAHLNHQKYILESSDRGGCSKCGIITIRVIVNLIIISMLGNSGFLIYWVNNYASEYLKNKSSSGGVVVLIVQFLPSVTITVLNVIVPIVFGLLIKLEDYTEHVIIGLTLIRTVFLRLASLAMLVASLLVTIKCSNNDPLCNVGGQVDNNGQKLDNCIEIRCWETYVGQAFYKLMVTDFFVHILVIFCYELPRKKLCKRCGPGEFDVPKSVLSLVYTQALCWLGFLYCPLITGMAVVSFLTQFYLKLFSALYTTSPPEKPYKASKSNVFFMIVLIATFVLCSGPVVYSMVAMTPSTGCGPFRIYSDMSVIIDVCIANTPTDFQTFVDIITARSFVITLLIILSITISCLLVWGNGYCSMAQKIKEELLLERKDKDHLIAKLSGSNKTNPKINDRQNPRKLNNGQTNVNDERNDRQTSRFNNGHAHINDERNERQTSRFNNGHAHVNDERNNRQASWKFNNEYSNVDDDITDRSGNSDAFNF